ncbi:unnamed protein product [Victoria cruziana]
MHRRIRELVCNRRICSRTQEFPAMSFLATKKCKSAINDAKYSCRNSEGFVDAFTTDLEASNSIWDDQELREASQMFQPPVDCIFCNVSCNSSLNRSRFRAN